MKWRSNLVAEEDAAAVEAMRAGGAILVAATRAPEMSFWWETFSNVAGVTRNPCDVRRTCGGSSGGEVNHIS
jgi:fatty acid amide hydrolase 2